MCSELCVGEGPPARPRVPCRSSVSRRGCPPAGASRSGQASLERCLSVWQPPARPAHARRRSPVTHLVCRDQRCHKPATPAAAVLGTRGGRGRRWAQSQPAGLPPAPRGGGFTLQLPDSAWPPSGGGGSEHVPSPAVAPSLGSWRRSPGRPRGQSSAEPPRRPCLILHLDLRAEADGDGDATPEKLPTGRKQQHVYICGV